MSISAASNSYVPVFPSLSATRPLAVSGEYKAPKGVDPVKHATEMAQHYAGIAEQFTSRINTWSNIYNENTDDLIEAAVEATRQRYGDEAAEGTRLGRTLSKNLAKRIIETADQGLRAYFNVSGSTHTYDPKTDTYARGAFTASVNLGDSAVRFDSRKGPEVSIMGAAFTANFARSSIPQMGSLDYEVINPDELEAIRRHEARLLDREQLLGIVNIKERHDALMKMKLLDLKV